MTPVVINEIRYVLNLQNSTSLLFLYFASEADYENREAADLQIINPIIMVFGLIVVPLHAV